VKAAFGSLLVVALAACGGTDSTENQSSQPAAATQANIGSAETANATAEPAPADNSADSAAAVETAIPATMHGRWALVPGDCTTQWGDAKGLLTVTAAELQFYESRGKIAKVIQSAHGRITADFDFQGEGEEWQRRMTLERDGDHLVRTEIGEDAPEPFRYARCAG
jgi:hypothetical protein